MVDKVNTSFAWDWSFRNGLITSDSLYSARLHPTQIYEIFLDIILMAIIILYSRKLKKDDKSLKPILFLHAGGYAIIRFTLQFIRADRGTLIFGDVISVLQIFLFSIFLLSLIFFIKHNLRSKTVLLNK